MRVRIISAEERYQWPEQHRDLVPDFEARNIGRPSCELLLQPVNGGQPFRIVIDGPGAIGLEDLIGEDELDRMAANPDSTCTETGWATLYGYEFELSLVPVAKTAIATA